MHFSEFALKKKEALFKSLEAHENGLSEREVVDRRARFGSNSFGKQHVTWWQILLRQFRSPFLYLIGTATITDNDPTPSLALTGPATINEGAGTATYTVTLSAASGQTVTVAYGTTGGTATSGVDFTATCGTLTFAPGATVATFAVPITNDSTFEGSETFSVSLSTPTNATIGTGVNGSTAANGSLLIGNGSGYSLATLTPGSNAVTVLNGSGTITLDVDVDTSGTTATSFANSGLEKTVQGLRLIGGCADEQVLAWSSVNGRWECSNKTGGTSDWTDDGSTTYLTDVTSDFAVGGAGIANSILSVDVSAGAVYLGTSHTVNPSIIFEATDSDTATLGFNTNDSLYLSGGNFGIGDTSPLSLFTVGAGDAFQVNGTGRNVQPEMSGLSAFI
jgi:surface adhesion protein